MEEADFDSFIALFTVTSGIYLKMIYSKNLFHEHRTKFFWLKLTRSQTYYVTTDPTKGHLNTVIQ